MTGYTIKNVTLADLKTLQEISRETFKATFDPYTQPDDMEKFLQEGYSDKKLTAEINNPDSHFFFLMVGEAVAGYLKVNVGRAQTESLRPNALEVERIYLRAKFQHQGLGLVLIKLAEKIARQEQKDYMWLGVYEHNLVAQKFYAKDGFKRVSQHVYQVGTDPQVDYLLVKKL
ncbi:MAG: GNAT family N-acetyltransferase [Lactobacillus sp.]|jgi:ribosomal protein S18 acetylase RimI-like enzyme|nr:GNAT family N-acetyltransferase [Lactobacillus sp.]MCH3905529.1 GNAT family N-acetyltransferase [Lactobacillus sp.]MCH3990903.1 GNAT family N-acetyltransferase [Lactobacillus sp.]MCH4068381.1 GNAT family N-acetyltransferase [Lactobacillus sp.]MCI1304394.1 GNAT family N-acetyltransferase [Lactobacillus sp.]